MEKPTLMLQFEEPEPFCMCCGERVSSIRKQLEKQRWKKGKRIWNGHSQYKHYPQHIYDNCQINFCERCGQPLTRDEIHSTSEFMGMYGSARAFQDIPSGYTCASCDFEQEF